MKVIIALFIMLFLVGLGAASFLNGKGHSFLAKGSSVTIGKNVFLVEVENNEASREKGLSGQSSLQAGHGMLFLFDRPGRYGFWMKGMKFPLDIIFIKGNVIADIAQNAPTPKPNTPDTSLPIYSPRSQIDKALEIPAGTAKKDNIKIGDTVTISL